MEQKPRRSEPTGLDLPDGLWAGIAAAAAAPAASSLEPEPAAPVDWRTAYLAEHGLAEVPPPVGQAMLDAPPSAPGGWIPPAIPTSSIAPRPSPLGPGERKLLPQPRRQDADPPRFPRWSPGDTAATGPAYMALLDYVYGPPFAALLAALRAEPLFAYARTRWTPADARGNAELLAHLYDRIAALMATYFDFEPAAMAYVPQMRASTLALYMPDRHLIALSGHHVRAPLAEAVDSLVHELTHALQYERTAAELRGHGHGVDPYERSLVRRWAWELPRLQAIPYKRRAIEIHAHLWGGWAGEAMRQASPAP